jgi:hypothetical protein
MAASRGRGIRRYSNKIEQLSFAAFIALPRMAPPAGYTVNGAPKKRGHKPPLSLPPRETPNRSRP